MAIDTASLMYRVDPQERPLLCCVESTARSTNRPARPLHLQALLQLPRYADARGYVPISVLESLLPELAQELPDRSQWFPPGIGISPRLLRFHSVAADMSCDITRRFHYLRSPRTDGRAYGLSTDKGHLVALCVSSPLDVKSLRDLLVSHGRPPEFARVVSRVFAFEGAPKNSISYMLSRAAREEQGLGATDFVTYVNPNMGFTGSSYRASDWRLLGTEPGTKYRYIDGRYATDRELATRFGRYDDQAYQSILGTRFAASIMPLEPLLVFHTSLNKSANHKCRPVRNNFDPPVPD